MDVNQSRRSAADIVIIAPFFIGPRRCELFMVVKPLTFLLWLLLCWGAASYAPPVLAGDLASEVRQGVTSPSSANGGYLELGIYTSAYASPFYGLPEGNKAGQWHTKVGVSINGRYQYNGFFVEAFSESLEQFTLGYSAVNTDYWSLDVVGLEGHGPMSKDQSDDFATLNSRDADFSLGLRSTWYWQQYIAQMHILTDVSDTHNGQVYSLKFGRNWLYHNWNFHSIVGAIYRSDNVADYYYSVHPDEASLALPEFRVTAGVVTTFEVGVTYPVSEKWVFRSLIRYARVPKQWQGSPLFVNDHGEGIATSISYVF